ncbi:ankyrin-1-like isoform X2 [Montipora capricornis]|uniref:ankyrin-1-like isoform X2 n=1 Tax=Montipora capricornis TaxID=246305 RepID=UPI0035F1915F
MANRRSGSSWSLFGEGDVYSEDVDPFKAIYDVSKQEIQGIYETKGMACSVYVKKDEKQVAHFVTWSGVTKDLLNKPAQVNRFSSKHLGKYSAPVDSNSTVETFGHFSFLPAGSIFASLPSKKVFVVAFKPFEQEEDLEAYYFVGSEKRTLKLDTNTHKLVTSEKDKQKLRLSLSSVLGAPIIVRNKKISPRNSGRWCVVGVVGRSREGELCPHFVTNEIFGLPGPSDAVQPPISQTPENSTNPPGGEAVDASGMDSKTKRRRKEETASGMSGDEISLSASADKFLKILISAPSLDKEQQERVYKALAEFIQNFEECRDHSSDNLNALVAFIKLLESGYQASLVSVGVSPLEVILDCQTLKGLEHLWNDYLSGHLNSMAEQYLVTDEMKQKLGLDEISLKTTIEEEDYLICKKALLETPVKADHACLSSQEGVLHQGSGASGMDTSADYKAVSRSALHRATVNGQYEEVNRHLNSGANVNERDQFSLTPLHLACWYGHESVVKLLLDHNADVNAVDRFQFTPLQKAERWNHRSIIQLLLDHDAKPSFQQPLSLKTFAKRAFLRADSHSGFKELQTVVLQVDDDIVCQASTVLDYFVEEMKWITISIILSENPRHPRIEKLYKTLVDIDETINELHLCAKSGDVEKVIELVLNDGMDVNVAAKNNITPLLWASTMSSGVLIKTLIDLGADVNAQTAPGKQGPLLFAVSNNNYVVARFLLEHGAEANIQAKNGEAPLHKAAKQKEPALVKLLLENKADANIQDQQGETPLHKAVFDKDTPVVKLLLENKADVNIQDQQGETPLHKAVWRKDVPVVKLLLENKADVNIQAKNGRAPLHKAAKQKDSDLVKLLLENKADANIQDQEGETRLHKAVFDEDIPVVKLLLKNKADVNIQAKNGEAPLHKAAKQKDPALVKLLLENKADANIQDQVGKTPLHKAVFDNNIPVIKLLLENKADVNIQAKNGEAPLHKLATQNDPALVKLLLENKLDANIQDREGETPLHKAVWRKDVPLVELLLENKADANIQGQNGETALHKAVFHEEITLVKLLLESKVDANIQDQEGETPLHKAVRWRNEPHVKLLLKNKAYVNIQNGKGEAPLHKAVSQKDERLVTLLLENKADANIQGQNGETPLHKAVFHEEITLVKLLLENKADADIQDQLGNTPLHICARRGFSGTSQMLIEFGCNINLRNKKGETPSDIQTSRRQ